LRGRTHDVVGQIEYDSILPFPYLDNKDREIEDLSPYSGKSRVNETSRYNSIVILKLPTRFKCHELKFAIDLSF
jgi:hypothetical protein